MRGMPGRQRHRAEQDQFTDRMVRECHDCLAMQIQNTQRRQVVGRVPLPYAAHARLQALARIAGNSVASLIQRKDADRFGIDFGI
jgi:hypothetical protein